MMNWIDCSDRMDQYVIKKDGTAVDIEYFMATHVPFRDLEFIEFGDTESKPIHLNENQIYDQYIVNRANKHQMLVVRGTHGSGKSHLICWLHNRFVSDPINYNPSKEKVVFLRRLRNTVRGAVQQMLDEGIVRDKDLQEKFERFTASTESKSEEEFKASIYTEYALKAQTDNSGFTFKPKVCKDIAAFLLDSRVQEYMMREDGPVDRCFQKITSGANSVVTDNTEVIFTEEDFVLPKKVAGAIKREASEEVRSFYLFELRDDEKKIKKLTEYLNHYTSKVIQGCANITSENARDLFVDLRKSLHKEGKNLTIFIEDFTSFSIVESELITALSVENGGAYKDLCRVNSIIGITDGYYGTFRDNFKTRVTKQIMVTENSFSGQDFLLEMTARYLNAIYCETDAVKNWYQGHAVGDTLPKAIFKPDIEWDNIQIGKEKYTLYPFNKKSIITFYNRLRVKTTRNFLTYVIQHFFQSFADGMEYQEDWSFPELPPFIDNVTLQPPYADSVENTSFTDRDKQRMKVLFSIWGDGTTDADDRKVGGIDKKFLVSIGLGKYEGIKNNKNPDIDKPKEYQAGEKVKPNHDTKADDKVEKRLSREEISFKKKKMDIESWYEEKKTLELASDFNKWVGDFVLQGIAWQDEGYPGDLVTQRKNDGNFVDIEDSKLATNRDKAVVVLNRNSESRTILLGLTYFDYYKSWDFEDAAYYQLILVNWLEKNKNTFINRVFGDTVGTKEHPVITWCLAAEYLQRLLYGEHLSYKSDEELLEILLTKKPKNQYKPRSNQSWNDIITYLTNQASMVNTINALLKSGSKTVMGIVGETTGLGGRVSFYQTRELLNSIEHLKEKNWDISDELDDFNSYQYEKVRKFLKALYIRTEKVIEEEKKLAKESVKSFVTLLGDNPTQEVYIDVVNEIKILFSNCLAAHEPFKSELKIKFDEEPQILAKETFECFDIVQKALDKEDIVNSLILFSNRTHEKFKEQIFYLREIEKMAQSLDVKHRKLLGDEYSVDPVIVEGALNTLEKLSEKLEEMEVSEC